MKRGAEGVYYDKKESELFDALNTSINGLSEEEVESRRKYYGYNQLKRKKPAIFILLRQFNEIHSDRSKF